MQRVIGHRLSWLVLSLSLLFAGEANSAEGVLKAGAAIADITPPLGELVVGGFAPFPAKTIHDNMHARCLVLDNGETRIAFVICDNLGITRDVYDEARELIAKETGFPTENILMAATHTHSGTRANKPKYRPIVVKGIAESMKKALKNLEPAQIGFGRVNEPTELFNRRWFVTDPALLKNPFGKQDKVRMNPPRGSSALLKPAGPVDPEISFLSVQSLQGRPIALLANYSLHYVGGVNRGDVSADYFGIFSQRIGELINANKASADKPAFVGMLTNGTSGDVNNINFPQKGGKRYAQYEKMTEVAEKVAQKVKTAYANLIYQTWVPLGSASKDLTLTVRKPDAEMQAYFKKVLAQPETATVHHRYERNYAARVQTLLDGPDELTVPLQAVRIGNVGIAAIPFEVFTEIGLEIKEKSPFENAFTIELANSTHGYLPTPAQHKLGGYETWMGTNRVQLDASEKITETIFKLMSELKKP